MSNQGNTPNEIQYIRRQYIKQGVLTADGNKIPSAFDYNIYPWEQGYIPKCAICTEMYNKFVSADNKDNIHAPHNRCGCLWFDWYKDKIIKINPDVKFTKGINHDPKNNPKK